MGGNALIDIDPQFLTKGDVFTIDFPADGHWEAYRGRKFRVVTSGANKIDIEFVKENEVDPDGDLFE